MWSRGDRGTDARNELLDAALEFGTNWRRDVSALASERLPELPEDERAALAREIEEAREAIEQWVVGRFEAVRGHWERADAEAGGEHVRATYPWMDERNVSHAISQATYYAWHG